MHRRLHSLAITVLLAGCGGVTETSTDAGTPDTATGDSAHIDSSADTDARPETPLDAPTTACGDKTCAPGEVCVRTYTSGGPCMMCGDDAAACPSGWRCSGTCCVVDKPSYAYACKPSPSCGAVTCESCGKALCESWCPCESVVDGVLTCHCLAP